MLKHNKYFKYDGYTLLFALFVALYFVYSIFSDTTFELTALSNLYIGQATKDAVNIGARSSIVYKGLFTFVPIFLLAYYLFSRFLGQKDNRNLVFLSAVGILQILISALAIGNDKTIHLFFYVFWFIALLLSIPLPQHIKETLASRKTAAYNVVLSFLLIYNFQFYFPQHTWINQNTAFVYILLFMLLSCLPVLMGRKIFNKIQPYFSLLAFTPLLAFLAIEMDVHQVFEFGYKKIALFLFFIVLVLTLLTRFLIKFQFPSTLNALKYCLIPGVLVFYILSLKYTPFIETIPEFFELANPANALAKIFHHQQIPILDFMSSHMLSEQFYGIIYTLFNGYHTDVSFYSYVFINDIIGHLVLYYFLNKAFNKPIYSLAFIVTFPFTYYFAYPPIFLGILAVFQIIKVVDQQSVKQYYHLFLLLVALLLWRLDTGVATLFTTIIFTPLFFFIKRQKIDFKSLGKALLLFLATLGILVTIACLLRSPEYVWNNFISALHYVKGSQAHGYSTIQLIQQHQYYIYHILFPVIAIVAIILSVFKLRKEKNRYLLYSIFLLIMYFANVQRGLVRHGFAEQKEFYLVSVFYIGLTLFIVGMINKKNIKEILFYTVGFTLILSTKFFNYHPNQTEAERSLTQSNFFKLPEMLQNRPETRVIGQKEFEKQHYAELKSFFDTHLEANESFIDFSNTPMLYFYLERKSPGFFNQNLQNTIDDKTQLHLINQLNTAKHPLVVYAHSPRNWFDRTDEVENTVRYYLLSEFIHQNYEPLGVVQGYSIWKAKNSGIAVNNLAQDTVLNSAQNFDYKYMAGLIGGYYATQNADYLSAQILSFTVLNTEKEIVNLPLELSHSPAVYLEVTLEGALDDAQLELSLINAEEEQVGTFTFKTHSNIGNRYMLRLSNHYLWHKGDVKQLELKHKAQVKITGLRALKDTRIEY